MKSKDPFVFYTLEHRHHLLHNLLSRKIARRVTVLRLLVRPDSRGFSSFVVCILDEKRFLYQAIGVTEQAKQSLTKYSLAVPMPIYFMRSSTVLN